MEKNYISFKELEATRNAREIAKKEHDWETIDKLDEKLEDMYPRLMPEVGMPCTEILYSDTYGSTITKVFTPNKIAIRHNKYTCKGLGEDCECEDELYGSEIIYTRRKNGCWYGEGQKMGFGSCRCALGYRHTYIDPSF